MAIKDLHQTDNAPHRSSLSDTPSRRSSRLNPSVSEDSPCRTAAAVNLPPGKILHDESSLLPKNSKRKRKYFEGPKKKRRKIYPGNRVVSDALLDQETQKDKTQNVADKQTETLTELVPEPVHRNSKKRKILHEETEVSSNDSLSKKPLQPLDSDHFQKVKATLHLSNVPESMICRDVEQDKILKFCKDHILQMQPGSLYICGCPGTGKSLLMERLKSLASKWSDEGGHQAPEIISFNCTSLTKANDAFLRIMQNASTEEQKKKLKSSKGPGLNVVKHHMTKHGNGSMERMVLLIVDELDYLLGKDQSILHELFELPAQRHSRCIMIGISNSINLTDRLLPNFSTLSCRPMIIPFSPYTKDQVIAVLNQRTKVLPFPVFHPAALELCARKVAAASGDMRKALHVCRIAVELLESEICTELENKSAGNETENDLRSNRNDSTQPLVQIHHMALALSKTFRSAAVDTVKSLPKHQQIVLCAAVRLFRDKKKDTTIGQLNIEYVEFCKSTGMAALSVPEFSSVCRVLADQGLLNLGSSREERLRRVTLQVDENDVVFALQAIRFFSNVLN